MCNFTTNTTAVTIVTNHTPKSRKINLRIAQSIFSLRTSDQDIKVIFFRDTPQGSWRLWQTEFHINSFHTKSSDKNFTKNLDKIVSYDYFETFHGTISETQYASGIGFVALWLSKFCKRRILVICVIKEITLM